MAGLLYHAIRRISATPSTEVEIQYARMIPNGLNPVVGVAGLVFLHALLAGCIIQVVLPRLREDPGRITPAEATWIRLWLPVILAAPLVMVLSLAHDASRDQWAAWYAVSPAVIVACFSLGLISLIPRSRYRVGGFDHRDGLLLCAVASVLSLAAMGDRLTVWHGQALLTTAVLWMWICTSARPGSSTSGEPHEGQGRSSNAREKTRGPVFLLDWSGRLDDPIPGAIRAQVFVLILLIGVMARLNAQTSLATMIVVGGLFQLAVMIAAVAFLGPGRTQHVVLSTLLLSVLVGLAGVVLVRTNPVAVALRGPESLILLPEHLMGVSSIKAAALVMLGIGFGVLLAEGPQRRIPLSVGLLLLLCGWFVLLSSSQSLMELAINRVESLLPSSGPPLP